MIPRIQTGTSFQGAGLYYLHDKKQEGERERLTTDRVAWTYAINTLEEEPEAVLAEMAQTARDQGLLKHLAGKRPDGRPTERTVMTVALAWSPEQEPPTKEHMIETGRSYLQHMGWQEHQVLFVSHNDTKHPHVHLIINRVHPETGMTLDDAWSKTRAQRWALGYEREHGRIFCEAREAKYGKSQDRDAPHMNYREWQTWQQIAKENARDPEFRQTLEAGEWDALKQGQKQERIGFWKETGRMRKDLRAALREEVREEFAGEWQTYTLHKAERMEQAQAYDRETRRALREYRKHGKLHGVEAVAKIKERQEAYHDRLRDQLKEMRADISSRQKQRLEELAAPALDKLSNDRLAAYDEVRARHRGESATLHADQAAGTRRPDVLEGYGKGTDGAPLTAEQASAYLHHAKSAAARPAGFDQARGDITGADRARSPKPERDPLQTKPGQEISDRAAEKRDKDQAQDAKRRAGIEWYLAKRKDDRERGDGGRER
jgi:Relaxase/Mobilisation nuclease domain